MSSPLPTIAALWMEGGLSFLEQLCLKSFLDAGHRVILFHYGALENVPEGVECAPADQILPQKNFLQHERTGSPALHSDLFRYRLLAQMPGVIWADTDAYCLRPFETETGHFYGWESEHHVNGGVLGMPADCDTLRALLDYTRDDFAIPSWYGPAYQAELEARRDAGDPVHASEQPWGVWGPHAITHFLGQTGEIRFALPQEVLYPFRFRERRLMLRPGFDCSAHITQNTRSIHLYGRRMRARLREKEGGVPRPNSLLGQLLRRHGIDPARAPLSPPVASAPQDPAAPGASVGASVRGDTRSARPALPRSAPSSVPPSAPVAQPLAQGARQGRGCVNLSDLADGLGLDKGPQKHRYTELYQMLFLPRRQQDLTLLELCAPDPEAHCVADLPTLGLWRSYFTRAQICGIGPQALVSDPGSEGAGDPPRPAVQYRQAQMGDVADLMRAAQDLPAPDIVIDDGSHASAEQMAGLLALWPRLRPGGLYILEDLRWQPPGSADPQSPPIAGLIAQYLDQGVFAHPDPAIAAQLNDWRADISGCFLFQAQFRKSKKDQLAVLHKR